MKKNIVLIETMDSMGTGILYPCKYEKTLKFCKSYLVFTNGHVLHDVGAEDSEKDYRNNILLQIYDDFGKKVPCEKIKRILLYGSNQVIEKKNDVAALLVDIDENITITLATKIYEDDIEEEAALYMEGYPGVMLEDEVSQKIQLKGKAKKIFPDNKDLGVYQITDDYHWYNNFNDLKLMEGFSGSPVFIKMEKESYLVGLNQSVANIYNGENPFKLVYYLKMKQVLNLLRNSGCIIYRKQEDGSYQIEWIYGLDNTIDEYENNPTVLLLGGSGAGKSSFAIDFALHRDKICVSNDGQTTRTNIIYEYKLLNKENNVRVQFYNKEQFCEQMHYLYGVMPMLCFFQQIFGLSEKPDRKNTIKYLQDCYYLIDSIRLNKKRRPQWFDKMENFLFINRERAKNSRVTRDEIWDFYESAIKYICAYIPVPQVRYICDFSKISEVCDEFGKKIEDKECDKTELLKRIIHNIFEFNRDVNEEIDDEIVSVLLSQLIEKRDKKQEFNVRKYQVECCKYFLDSRAHGTAIYRVDTKECIENNRTIIRKIINTTEFQKGLMESLLYIDGFFSIDEFDFLKVFNEEEQNEFAYLDLWNNEKLFSFGKAQIPDLENVVSEYSKSLYDTLIKYMEAFWGDRLIENKGEYSLTFDLENLTKQEETWLTRCLQVKNGNSVTGMVRSVKIQDEVSNEYALMFKELKMSGLKILDTYGLDHVEWENGAEDALYDIKYRYQEMEHIKLENIGLLYLKKLDSGRPEELKNILPVVCRVMPQAPLYSVFTGIDIFYGKRIAELKNGIKWKKENAAECPKSVQYLLSDRGREEIFEEVYCSQEKKENYYHVLKNNIVPFCGNRSLVETQYGYYSNNLKHVRQLLSSIIMKEYSSIEIVDIEEVERILESEEGYYVISDMLEEVFEEASVRMWNFHHKTVRANFERITHEERARFMLGFCRTNRHQWNQLFHEAYAKVMVKENGQFLELFRTGKGPIEAALINCEDAYLGTPENLHNGILPESEKNEFRKLLEEMYQSNWGKIIYKKANPFSDKIEDVKRFFDKKDAEIKIIDIREYMENVTDFAKGFRKNEIVKDKFIKLLIETLIKKIKKENELKAKNLVGLNLDFANALKELKDIFDEKYGDLHDGNENKFYEIMKYHFTRNE